MINSLSGRIERAFLPIALAFSAAALIHPPLFVWIKPHIAPALGLIMFGMGLTLDFSDFAAVLPRWPLVLAGAGLQYLVMPLLALLSSTLFGLELEAAVGLALVGACPGGTASNVICYLAGGNVALSVTMTMVSTALAPVLTPAIVYALYDAQIAIDFWGMARSVFWIVVFPLVDGLVLRRLLRHRVAGLVRVFPSFSILAISAVIACVVGLNQATILSLPLLVMGAVLLHSSAGFGVGYAAGRVLSSDRRDAVTLSIEVGMQNSGLGVALANTFFTARAALPGALFSLVQNLVGVSLARVWKRRIASGRITGAF
ncbi:MAG: bile acid:sodium symporter family protein [Desulfovibrio sp.]|nr:bile acid:sodium symporter family protein [Desulfovibrio sp.]